MTNILVPFDFSSNAKTALGQALLIAGERGFSVGVLHIHNAETIHDYPKEWRQDPAFATTGFALQKLSEAIKAEQERYDPAKKIAIIPVVKESAMINGGIINEMLTLKADLIVMGTHGATNALDRFWGSNTATMINHALFPVMAVPRDWSPEILKNLIAAIAPHETGVFIRKALKWAGKLQLNPELVSISSIPEADQELFDKALEEFPALKAHLVPKKDELPLWRSLVNFTSNYRAAILLMFVHERTVLEKLFNYSITSKVADGIHIPLLAIPSTP